VRQRKGHIRGAEEVLKNAVVTVQSITRLNKGGFVAAREGDTPRKVRQ